MNILMLSGGMLMISGLLIYRAKLKVFMRIIKKCTNTPHKFSKLDLLNTRQFEKWRKLSTLAEETENEELREDAKKSLRLEFYSYLFFISGIVLYALSVQ